VVAVREDTTHKCETFCLVQSLTGVLVLVASPGDALDERAAVQSGVNDWNVRTGRRLGVALLPWLWERHGIPQMGGRPQSLINRQALNQADVVVAFFDSRLGTATGVDVSGTAEEISRAEQDGKPVHLYFSAEPLPRDADLGQVAALRDFRTKLSSTGLLGEATDTADLAGQVIRALEADIDQYGWSTSVPEVTPRSARLGWTHEYQQQEKVWTSADESSTAPSRTTSLCTTAAPWQLWISSSRSRPSGRRHITLMRRKNPSLSRLTPG
jgi:hypothetical protein